MSVKRVFYSFHYKPDCWRAATVRSIGSIEGNKPASDNEWESVEKSGDAAIEKWIADQMKGRSCTLVLVGKETAGRKWIDHEIKESWKKKMGIVGIYIHGLRNQKNFISTQGKNPFKSFKLKSGERLSDIVKCYNPPGNNSKERYAWIKHYLSFIIDEAIKIRMKY